ncbi:putative DNA binding protein [Corchorus olitorius]|uniref:DNA binding protein n=1 Tax=Corchorus olitorius TaxID=93759 RepID=A0A1R3GHK2_9ROSI|nr:putative DNA binding protein [Corchorus olitorius]
MPVKRMKRRVTVDLYDFLTFPSSASGSGVSMPFRTNVRAFLTKHALMPPPSSLFPHLMTWQILFRVGDATEGPDSSPAMVFLDVVEEDVARSRSIYCNQCRVVGWSGHPVCSKRYHFIIKADGNSIGGYRKPCVRCGDVLHLSELRKVSVMDVSKKYGLEYRLLHAIIKGHPWYGDWGYEIGAGSFALTFDAYKSAVETLSSLPAEDATCKKPHTSSSGVVSWSRADVARIEEAMFRVLRAVSGSNWVSSRALRGAVCRGASPELLDHCIMELGGKMAAEGMVVTSRRNPDSGALEYSSAEKLLDCKQFVKDYMPEKLSVRNEAVVSLLCHLELVDQPEEVAPNPPAELLVLPLNATVSDVKVEASKAFQDVYLAFRRFQAEELHTRCSGIKDSDAVPAKFVCYRCRESLHMARTCGQCKDETVSSLGGNGSFGKSLTTP